MTRIVFQLSNARGPEGEPAVSLSLMPKDLDSQEVPFSCSAAEDVFVATTQQVIDPDSIKLAGCRLFEAVSTHPDIELQLKAALVNEQVKPVYVWFATKDGVEMLPWEAMWAPSGPALGLDERWAIGRMATAKAGTSNFHTLEPPIRIAAVLSCRGITAKGELAALRKAIEAAPDEVQLLVLSSEEPLITELQAEIDAGAARGVRVELIPSDLALLQRRVKEFRPHLLHFFCHGSVAGGPHIQLAVKSDWEIPQPSRGMTAEAGQFREFRRDGDELWLIVLNCCESAKPDPSADSQSLALALIREGHAPAVIAMREPVVQKVTASLTSSFYNKLLSDLSDRLQAPGPPKPLDWARMIVAARHELARGRDDMLFSQAAASTKEWTLPVVYVNPDEFHVQVAPARLPPLPTRGGAEPPTVAERVARLEIAALQSLLRSLPPGQASDLRSEAVTRMRELAAQLGIELPPASLDPGGN